MNAPPQRAATDRRSARYRADVAARVLAAVLGGYGLVSLWILAVGGLPIENRARAVLGGSLAGIALYAAVVMWVFSVRSAVRAWAGLLAAAAVLGALAWLFSRGAPA